MTSDLHRAQLSEFLKGARARLSPTDVGLPKTGRRRTPGLRREDVAVLAGVSLTWYTWLEQGRQVRASERVLDNISVTLRLNADERDYLFSLVQNRPAPLAASRSIIVPASVQRTLDALEVPALIMTMRWDVIAWNAMVAATFRDYASMPADGRNLIKILLSDPRYLADPREYNAVARRVLSKLRVDYSLAVGDPAFDALIEDLTEQFPIFAKLWSSTEISTRSEGLHTFHHAVAGDIDFEHTSYIIEGVPTLRVVIFAPQNAESARKLETIARSLKGASKPAGESIPAKASKRAEKAAAST